MGIALGSVTAPAPSGRVCRRLFWLLLLVMTGSLLQACAVPAPSLVGPDPESWPTPPQPRRTPIPLPEATAAPATRTATPTRAPADFIGRQRARVLRVWDGQSVLIENGLTVRYLGIQTAGAGMFRRPLEPLGGDAAVRNAELVEGKEVELEQDVTDVDADGQLPRYVYADGKMVNLDLVRLGLAQAAVRPPDLRYRDQLLDAEREARDARRGLWTGAPTLTRTVITAPPVTPRPASTAGPTGTPTPRPTATPGGPPTLGASVASPAPATGSTPAAPVPAPSVPAAAPPAAPTAAPPGPTRDGIPRFGE
jgi:endonuclease YncB( thermonuclease family)